MDNNQTSLQLVQQKLRSRNYAISTQNTYYCYISQFLQYCKTHNLQPARDANPYIQYLIDQNQSISAQNQAINAIKFYWEQILGKERSIIEIDRPMKEHKLPTVLSQQEIQRLFSTISNRKHRLILATIYSCGLRISEVINLTLSDIDSDRMCIHIKQSKGRKDRIVPLPKQLLVALRKYYREYKPTAYLFEGVKQNEQATKYSASSIRQLLRRAVQRARIQKKVSPHTLRHSYATHLYENGLELRSIQYLLGHNSSKTTEIYTQISTRHIQNLPNPLDYMTKFP